MVTRASHVPPLATGPKARSLLDRLTIIFQGGWKYTVSVRPRAARQATQVGWNVSLNGQHGNDHHLSAPPRLAAKPVDRNFVGFAICTIRLDGKRGCPLEPVGIQ